MKTNILLIIITLIVGGTYTYIMANKKAPAFSKTTKEQIQKNNNNETIDNFTYKLINGKNGELYDHKNNIVLVHFWATWCPPCILELPELISLAKKKKNITVLAISSDSDVSNINRFIKKLEKKIPENFLIITDPDKKITKDVFQTIKLPETFILNPNLSINRKIIGAYDDWASPDMIKELSKIRKISE